MGCGKLKGTSTRLKAKLQLDSRHSPQEVNKNGCFAHTNRTGLFPRPSCLLNALGKDYNKIKNGPRKGRQKKRD